ncbi:MAG: hypothetical protein VZT48_09480 [Bulleidia sp.]|nr:hypothetical protein [Bulleidia sp.]
MTNANTFKSMVGVLLAFGALYFIVLGIVTLKNAIHKKLKQKKES